MAYGSPTRMEDVMEYLGEIYEGKPVPQYAVEENTKKYRMFGGKSPSNGIVESVAAKLSTVLQKDGEYRVFLGNKHWKPTLEEAVSGIAEYDPDMIIAIPLFPFPSENVENSYSKPLIEAMKNHGLEKPIEVVNGFNEFDLFIRSWQEVLENYIREFPLDTFYLFSAHSLPVMRNSEDSYRKHFFETAGKLAGKLGIINYAAAFQSRGRYGTTWLEPSLEDALISNMDSIGESVVAIPLGFIYDHLEILYDLDHEFGNLVGSKGKKYYRSPLPNDSDTFVQCLRAVVVSAASGNK